MITYLGEPCHFIDNDGNERAGVITHVFNDTCVNITYFGTQGGTESATSVVYESPLQFKHYSWHRTGDMP